MSRLAPRVARVPYPVRALVRFAALMLAVSFATFLLVGLSPVDPVQANVGQAAYLAMSPEHRAALAERWGAGTGVIERYLSWLADALRGDLGVSLRFNRPVAEVIGERLAGSATLMALSWLVSGVTGTALGVVAGAREGTLADRAIRLWCYLLSGTPTFWIALMALMVFSVWLGWFPVGLAAPIGSPGATGGAGVLERLHHLALPAIVLSLTGVADVALHTREKTIDVMASDYARFARARGEGTAEVVLRHGLRNLALPAVTIMCSQVSEIVGGSILVEQVFSYPGLGQAAVTAGIGGDAPLLVGIALATAAIVFLGNLAADVLYGVIDPAMREGRGHVA